ncbi:MAG: DUF6371 domain-containing protein [Rikenellaceae bacterium]
MKMYRFSLERYAGVASRHTCPECGHKRCFVRYVDSDGDIVFPEYVGRCNREDKCGYHFTPKQYFEESKLPFTSYRTKTTPPPPKPTSYIPSEMVGKTLMRHQGHHLFTFLSLQIGKEATDKLMGKYRVTKSTVWEGATLFWQMDIKDRTRTGKIMLYDPQTGRRVKSDNIPITWVHARLRLPNFNLTQCFFGEHLLSRDEEKTIAIVESEKTSLIAAHYLPDFTWIATGGKNGCLKSENLEVLKGRKVMLVPDLGATEYWQSKLPLFLEKGVDATILDHLEDMATPEQRNEGYDIADFLLDGNSPEIILQKMIEKNPAIKTLIDTFDLELIEMEKHFE